MRQDQSRFLARLERQGAVDKNTGSLRGLGSAGRSHAGLGRAQQLQTLPLRPI